MNSETEIKTTEPVVKTEIKTEVKIDTKIELKPQNLDIKIEELYTLGGHYGYKRARRHPSCLPYLHSARNGSDIINLDKTRDQIIKAFIALSTAKAAGKKVLFVGTKPEARESVKQIASSLDMSFVDRRFVGGTITNFSEIGKRINAMNDLNKKQAEDTLVFKTKKEKLMIEREIIKLNETFGGLKDFTNLPGLVVIVDPKKESIAVTEAIRKRIPIIALSNSDCNIANIDFPIIVNEASKKSVELVLMLLKEALTS